MKKILFVAVAGILLFSISGAVFAATYQQEKSVALTNPVSDDLYAIGAEIRIDHNVSGDLLALGGNVIVRGDIDGDVMVMAKTVQIDGNVSGDVRVLSSNFTLNGHVGEDVVTAGSDVIVGSNATVGADLLVGGGNVEFDGTVHGNLKGESQIFSFRGWVDRDVFLSAKKINLSPNAHITGNFTYSSLLEMKIPDQVVAGTTEFIPSEKSFTFGKKFWGFLSQAYLIKKGVSFFGYLLVGLILFWLVPGEITTIARHLHFEFFRYLGKGFLYGLAWVVIIVAATVTIIGLPIGLILSAMLAISLYVSTIFSGMWLGGILIPFEKRSKAQIYGIYALGLLLFFLIGFIPIVGWVFQYLAILASLGGFLERRKDMFDLLKQKRFFALPTK